MNRHLVVRCVLVAAFVLLVAGVALGATLPYEVDLSNVPNGSLPPGWYPLNGDWQVVDGTLEGYYPPAAGDGQGAFIFIPNLMVDDFDLQLTMEFKSAAQGSRFGAIMFRSAPATGAPRHKLQIRQRTTDRNGIGLLYRDFDKKATRIGEMPLHHDFELNTPYRVRLVVFGDRIKLLIEDTLVMDLTARTYLQKGGIGFVVHGATVRFSNIRIDSVDEEKFNSIY